MNTQNFSMDDLIQRFAVSALSKERKDEAVNEEILVGKYTGEFFIKSKDGIVISTDVLNRLKSSTDNAIRVAESVGMVGNLYKLDFDNLPMPLHVDYDVNLIEGEPIRVDGECKSLLFNIDFDEFDIIGDVVKPVNSDAMVKINIELMLNGVTELFEIEKSIQSINQTIIDFKDYIGIQYIEIKNITINKDEVIFNDNAVDRTMILHNLFMSVNI
jgi:hypothetical protein